MKKITTTIHITLIMIIHSVNGQPAKTTKDLDFLLGEWEVIRTYSPGGTNERILAGELSCKWALDSTFIECTYLLERPGKRRGIDRVYFNYNTIYDKYESTWMSSTWPIKATSSGEPSKGDERSVLTTRSEFPIHDGIIEFVKTDWQINWLNGQYDISRKTFIRTSKDAPDYWFHHMNEQLIQKK